MKHTDHSRLFLLYVEKAVEIAKRDPRNIIKRGAVTTLVKQATKFLLPGNGILLDDPYLKGMDEKVRLGIPYPLTVIEFPEPWGVYTKTILTLEEMDDTIRMYVTVFHEGHNKWGTMAPLLFNREHYIERNEKGEPDFLYSVEKSSDEMHVDHLVYHPYVVVFLQFLNALSCRNVEHESSPPGAVRRAKKGPIPYDSYRILTTNLGGGGGGNKKSSGTGEPKERKDIIHSSPREHLRRGHIVRHQKGFSYWRNATLVMPGNGGRILKDYSFKK